MNVWIRDKKDEILTQAEARRRSGTRADKGIDAVMSPTPGAGSRYFYGDYLNEEYSQNTRIAKAGEKDRKDPTGWE